MRVIRVQKAELLERISANRENHRRIFEAALEGYREAVIGELEDRLAQLRRGKGSRVDVVIRLPEPQDHTRDYDRVIHMLTMEVAEEVEIDEQQFAQYVEDDWSWKREFYSTASTYTALAR